MPIEGPRARDLASLFTVSAAILAFEVAASRLIAIEHQHHLAPLVIAIALLGFGAAGILVTIRADAVRRDPDRWLFAGMLATGLAIEGAALVSGEIPLNMLALAWEPRQIGALVVYGLVFLPPFLAGASVVSIYFVLWPSVAGRVYAADLLGGAAGALAVLPLMDAVGLENTVSTIAVLALAAAAFQTPAPRWRGGRASLARPVALAIAAAAVALAAVRVEATPADTKDLAVTRLQRGAGTVIEADGTSRRWTVVRGGGLHAAPGLSLASARDAPAQWRLFGDGDAAATVLVPPVAPAALFRETLGWAPWAGADVDRVLLLDATALWAAWTAQSAGATDIVALSGDGELLDVLRRLKKSHPAGVHPDGMRLVNASARRHLARATEAAPWDGIFLEVAPPEAGIAAAQEDHLLTVEGFDAAFERLSDRGALAVSVRLHALPRESVKLLVTIGHVLRARGLEPRDHVAAVRDWRTVVFVVGRKPLADARVDALRSWARRWSFDVVAAPGRESGAIFHRGGAGHAEAFRRALRAEGAASPAFRVDPATDDRPYFFHFLEWRALPRLIDAAGATWRQHLDWGYLLTLAVLPSGMAIAAIALALPFALGGTSRPTRAPTSLGFFAAIGIGFMWIEIGILQRASLLLDSTAIAMGTVLSAVLVGAGVGSLAQQRLPASRAPRRLAILLTAVLALGVLPAMHALFEIGATWPLGARMGLVALPAALLAAPMGMPLPSAMRALRSEPPTTIAWCWAVNAFAGVFATLSASLVAIHFGLTALLLAATGAYLAAAAFAERLPEPQG